jgi:hypothetical protein
MVFPPLISMLYPKSVKQIKGLLYLVPKISFGDRTDHRGVCIRLMAVGSAPSGSMDLLLRLSTAAVRLQYDALVVRRGGAASSRSYALALAGVKAAPQRQRRVTAGRPP